MAKSKESNNLLNQLVNFVKPVAPTNIGSMFVDNLLSSINQQPKITIDPVTGTKIIQNPDGTFSYDEGGFESIFTTGTRG